MAEIDYDAKTALLIVDVQNDFVDAQGNLYVKGGEQVVKPINREIRRALNAGATVVYTRDWHPPETPHFAPFGGKWPVHCVRDTWGSEFHPDLDIATRGQLSSGPARMAINTAGRDATTTAVREAMATGTQADGTIRLDNVFKVVVARA